MRFEWPHVLWLLPVLALWLWRRNRLPSPALAFPSLGLLTPGAASWRCRLVWLPEWLGALALAALIVALARPQIQNLIASSEIHGVAIELLVDLSSSMSTTVPDSDGLDRLAIVKTVLPGFIAGDGLKLAGRKNDLIGLVTFARYADTVCPQTTAHEALVEIIRNLTLEDRPNEDGTAYGDAVTLAAARLHALSEPPDHSRAESNIKSRVIVLLTDGENNSGRHLPLEATALAKKWGIRIYVISLVTDNPYGPSNIAPPPPPSAAEQILKRMASETGGIYRRARDRDSLENVYGEIDRLERSEIRLHHRAEWRDCYHLLLAGGLALLVAQMVLLSTLFRRIP